MVSVCFITAIFGGYESTCRSVCPQTVPVDCICFTDNKNMDPNGWTIVTEPYHLTHKNPQDHGGYINSLSNNTHTFNVAKYYKQSFQHIPILQKYDVVIWLDGTVEIIDPNATAYILEHIQPTGMVGWHHEQRFGNLSNEAYASLFFRYNSTYWNNQHQPLQDVIGQYRHYVRQGYTNDYFQRNNPSGSPHFGVWITCFVAFDMRQPKIKEFLEFWYLQTLQFTTQDQIGFSYACQKLRLLPHTLPQGHVQGQPHERTTFYIKHNHSPVVQSDPPPLNKPPHARTATHNRHLVFQRNMPPPPNPPQPPATTIDQKTLRRQLIRRKLMKLRPA